MGPAASDVSDSVRRPETSVRRPEMSWWRLLVKLESGARQTLGNWVIAFFPVFQSFFPECIAERAVIAHLTGFYRYSPEEALIGSSHMILADGWNRAENDSQKNCSQNSHSLSFLTILQNNINVIYFAKTKCQGRNKILLNKSRVRTVIFVHDRAIPRDFYFFLNPELIFFNSALYFNGKWKRHLPLSSGP